MKTMAEQLAERTRVWELFHAGLRYVYAGNLPGAVGSCEDTVCPLCRTALVRRRGFRVLENHIAASGACPQCGLRIPGVWARPTVCADDHVPLIHPDCAAEAV